MRHSAEIKETSRFFCMYARDLKQARASPKTLWHLTVLQNFMNHRQVAFNDKFKPLAIRPTASVSVVAFVLIVAIATATGGKVAIGAIALCKCGGGKPRGGDGRRCECQYKHTCA